VTDSPVAAARALLPWWVGWTNVLVLVPAASIAAALTTWVTAAIATRPLRRALRNGELPWQEHARLAFPFRRNVGRMRMVATLLLGLCALMGSGDFAYLPPPVVLLLVVFAAVLASGFVARRYRPRDLQPRPTWRERMRVGGFFAVVILRVVVVVFMVSFIGPELDASSLIGTGLGLAGFVLYWCGGVLPLLRWTRAIQQAPERLRNAVAQAARSCATEVPPAYLFDVPSANAFAIKAPRAVIATRRLLDILDDPELVAICTHEMGHLSEGRLAFVALHSGELFLLSIAFCRPLHALTGPITVAASIAGTFLFAVVVTKLVAARGERRADAIAHAHTSTRPHPGAGTPATTGEPDVYLRALEKLHRDHGAPLVLEKRTQPRRGLFRILFGRGGIHGSFADRAAALGVPLLADVAPPSRLRSFMARIAGTFVLAPCLTALVVLYLGVANDVLFSFDRHVPPELRIGLGGDAGNALLEVARARAAGGRRDDALVFTRAAGAQFEKDPVNTIDVAESFADLASDDEALRALASARAGLPPRTALGTSDRDEYLDEVWERLEKVEARVRAHTDGR
jgi:Zn-dependent protease with chaperone function